MARPPTGPTPPTGTPLRPTRPATILEFAGTTNTSPVNDDTAGQSFRGIRFAADAGSFTLSGNAIQLGGDITNNSSSDQAIDLPVELTSSSSEVDTGSANMSLGGNLSGIGGLTKLGEGTLILSGTNTYGGVTSVDAGTLQAGSATAFGSAPALAFSDGSTGTVQLNSNSFTVSSLTGPSGGVVENGGDTDVVLTVDTAADNTYAGALADGSGAGTLGLVKTGTGELTLSGDNSAATGGVTVSGGTLAVGSDTALVSGVLTVDGGVVSSDSMAARSVGSALAPGANAILGSATNSGKLTFTNSTDLGTADRTLTINSQVELAGAVNGTGGLIKAGDATLALSGDNTYTGATTVSGGTLSLSGDNTLATGGTVVNGGAVQFESAGAIGGSGQNVTINADGAVIFGSSFTDVATALAGRIDPASTGAVAADNQAATSFDFDSAGLGGMRLGAVANVTFTGTLTPNGTTYRLGGGGGTLTLGRTNVLTGDNSVVIDGKVTLAAANDNFNGAITVNAGTLTLGNPSPLGNASSITMADGVVLQLPSDITLATPIVLGSGVAMVQCGADAPIALNGPISGSGGLTLYQSSGGNPFLTVNLGSANTYLGDTRLQTNSGRMGVVLGADNALPTTTVLTFDCQGAGTGRAIVLDLNGHDQTLAGLTDSRQYQYNLIANSDSANLATLTVNNSDDYQFRGYLGSTNNPKTFFNGHVGDDFGLTKKGSGKLTLTANNSYTGDTSVEAGVLSITTAYLADAADVYLTTGAVLDLAFSGTDTIDQLFIDGVGQLSGTWGPTDSGADHESDLLWGNGLLYVTTAGSLPGDANNDGVVDAADYILVKTELRQHRRRPQRKRRRDRRRQRDHRRHPEGRREHRQAPARPSRPSPPRSLS